MAVAKGKVILLGEHAVVYGCPALVVGINDGAEASVSIDGSCSVSVGSCKARVGEGELGKAFGALLSSLNTPPLCANVTLRIPAGCGLGASAAAAVAIARAALDLTEPAQSESAARQRRILRAADAWERVFHGEPSGIDATAAALGGCFIFTRNQGPQLIKLKNPIQLAIAVADAPADTRSLVAKVAEELEANSLRVNHIFEKIQSLVAAAHAALLEGSVTSLGLLMDENHSLLNELGVSTPRLDGACEAARAAGALGAKLTGSGGGGCVVALCSSNPDSVMSAWKSQGMRCLSAIIADESQEQLNL